MNLRFFTFRVGWPLLAAACAACSAAGAGDDQPPALENGASELSPAREKALRQPPAMAASQGLCRAGEAPIFQCQLRDKHVAVCGGRAATGQVYAQYRFGSRDRIELEHPSRPTGAGESLTWARHAYSGGGEAQIAFTRDGFAYVVYSRVVRTAFGADGRHEPEDRAGVFVKKGSRLVADRRCTDAPDSAGRVPWVDLEAAARYLKEGEFRPWWDE